MVQASRLGRDDVSERDLFLLHVTDIDALPRPLDFPPGNFACLMVFDGSGVPADVIADAVQLLLDSGCVYLSTWGADCERVHDIIYSVCDSKNPNPRVESVIMTHSHADDSLDHAIWCLLCMAWPAESYFDACRSALVLCVGADRTRRDRIAFALTSPRMFCAEVLANENPENAT